MGNLVVAFIFVKPHILTLFERHPGGQWGSKRSKIAHPSKNDSQKFEICTEI